MQARDITFMKSDLEHLNMKKWVNAYVLSSAELSTWYPVIADLSFLFITAEL
jgi:hypothetical protein